MRADAADMFYDVSTAANKQACERDGFAVHVKESDYYREDRIGFLKRP